MSKKKSTTRRNLHASVFAIFIFFIFIGSIAFPSFWNGAIDAIGFGPHLNEKEFQLGLDLQGGTHLVYEADMSEIDHDERGAALDGVRDVIERRVNAFGVSEPVVQTNSNNGHYRVIVELAGVFDVSDAISLIGETPILEFKTATQEIATDLTPEEEESIAVAQNDEKRQALDVLDRALAGEDFGDLVREFSIDSKTQVNGGYYGYITENDPIFDGLASQISSERIEEGIINGLYESTSSLHIVNYLSTSTEEEVEASHILICWNEIDSCSSDRTKIEAQILADEILNDIDESNFAEKAIEFSDGPSSVNGGELGWFGKGAMVSAFEDAVFNLDNGNISSELVETEFGYHIIYRKDSREVESYEISHIEMPWTTASDVLIIDPWENTGLSGRQVKGAAVAFDSNTGIPYVVLSFDGEGSDLFAELTENNVGEVIGIFLDGEPISTPVVREAIYGGEASIQGNFTVEEAKLLTLRLNAGALPVPIELLSQQTIGPTLGAMSLDRSIEAALIGFLLIALFMVAWYRLPGLLAIASLSVYAVVNLTLYKMLGVTITLAGIAGFILSMGMAVDANVLIFERLKEEIKSGRDLPTAIDEGFRRAWTSIRDGNMTTLIAAVVLFSMSTSFIKGFALMLAIGILVSMLTAILVTRVFLKWTSGFKFLKAKWLYGAKK